MAFASLSLVPASVPAFAPLPFCSAFAAASMAWLSMSPDVSPAFMSSLTALASSAAPPCAFAPAERASSALPAWPPRPPMPACSGFAAPGVGVGPPLGTATPDCPSMLSAAWSADAPALVTASSAPWLAAAVFAAWAAVGFASAAALAAAAFWASVVLVAPVAACAAASAAAAAAACAAVAVGSADVALALAFASTAAWCPPCRWCPVSFAAWCGVWPGCAWCAFCEPLPFWVP
ncbi:MAG: hypothetical protein WDN30_08585 [Pararobbsia sp.]